MGFDLEVSVPLISAFIQGVLSFLSPCILPLLPMYIGYLSGGIIEKDGKTSVNQAKMLVNTLFFIIGISFAFILLAFGVSSFSQVFTKYQTILTRLGGALIILLGLSQLGLFDKPFKGRSYQLPFNLAKFKMNPITALLMGFIFSFAWTPCVGPTLSTILIMITSTDSLVAGLTLMLVYTLGFTLPFILVALFTTKCLNFFKQQAKLMQLSVKLGGGLMVLMGLMLFTGILNDVSSYVSKEPNLEERSLAHDFELSDQYGNIHTLADYQDKVIFLNFWATWCPPCKAEMPDVEELYQNYGLNKEDVIILGVASPKSSLNPHTKEVDKEGVIEFLEDSPYTYPTILDESGQLAAKYGISAYPTTFMIAKDQSVYGYVPGKISYEIMEQIIQQTLAN